MTTSSAGQTEARRRIRTVHDRVPTPRPTDLQITEALSDDASRRLLSVCIHDPKGVQRIRAETGLSVPAIYRRVNVLVRAGLLVAERSAITAEGKRYELYRSRIHDADIRLDESGTRVTWTPLEAIEAQVSRIERTLSNLRM